MSIERQKPANSAYQGKANYDPDHIALFTEAVSEIRELLEVLVIPADLGDPPSRKLIMSRQQPGRVIIYGDPGWSGAARPPWPIPCQFTRQGAVSVYLSATEVIAKQWRP